VLRFPRSHQCAAHSFANAEIKKEHEKTYDSGAVFEFEMPNGTRGEATAISNSPHQPALITDDQPCPRMADLDMKMKPAVLGVFI
jgi:hypothetical protein